MKPKRILLALWTVVVLCTFVLVLQIVKSGGDDKPLIGGPFRLKSQTGEIVSSAALEGRPYAIFFGFTRCPEICPTTMMDMQRLLDRLGPEANDFRVYFVSVDPERDTPEVLRSFLSSFDPRIVGLTGTPVEIAGIAKAFGVYYRKTPLSGDDYTMDHSAFVYLMDARGTYADSLGYQENEDRALAKLSALLAHSR